MSDKKELVIVGAGPGGYAAAFYAADLGMKVTLIDKELNPGGVCLYRGCIPSKALLHVSKLLSEANEATNWGIDFGKPTIDLEKLRSYKESVVNKLTGGTGHLRKQRKIEYIQGTAKYTGSNSLAVDKADGTSENIEFNKSILATGTIPTTIPGLPKSSKIWDSTDALNLELIPKSLLVIGGGYIGLELGSVYASLGSKVTVVEMTDGLLPGADRDLVRVLQRNLENKFESIVLNTKVSSVSNTKTGIKVKFESGEGVGEKAFDRVLISVGRRPITSELGLDSTNVNISDNGFVVIDEKCQTSDPSIFAIGDIVGGAMLAHKASAEGKVAVDAILGKKVAFEPNAIPAVVFTDPELAWAGINETEAKQKGIKVEVARFPWGASGRATTIDRNDGLTKLLIDPETDRILGMGLVGAGAGEMIAEGVLAIEMAALAKDVALSIHPHPTLSESVMEASEVYFGHSTHLYRPKRK